MVGVEPRQGVVRRRSLDRRHLLRYRRRGIPGGCLLGGGGGDARHGLRGGAVKCLELIGVFGEHSQPHRKVQHAAPVHRAARPRDGGVALSVPGRKEQQGAASSPNAKAAGHLSRG
eukprot:scaffold9042_cov112-Isochrysis_galbana.AAC.4